MTRLEEAAIEWWKERRPKGWTEERHLAFPLANCLVETDRKLAREAADLVKEILAHEKRMGR